MYLLVSGILLKDNWQHILRCLDEKLFDTTNRMRMIKILPLFLHKVKGNDFIVQSKMMSQRVLVKSVSCGSRLTGATSQPWWSHTSWKGEWESISEQVDSEYQLQWWYIFQ